MTADSRRPILRGRSPPAAGLLVVLVATSCSGDRDPGAQGGWDDVPRWSLSSRPALTLGGVAVADAELFGNLRGADRTADGSIVVADASTNDINPGRHADTRPVHRRLRADGRRRRPDLGALQSIGPDQIVAFDRGEFDVPLVVVYDIVR